MRGIKFFQLFAVVCCTRLSICAQTWTQTPAPTAYWWAVASSADGTKLVASDFFGGALYLSTNSGSTWFEATNASYFGSGSVASSADGAKLIAIDDLDNSIDTSDDSGITWTQTSAPGGYTVDWFSDASSTDGTQLTAASYNFSWIYVSTNSGQTWTQSGAPIWILALGCVLGGRQ